jgi:hypothetical protein
MKKFLFVILVPLMCLSSYVGDCEYCNGWNEGYSAGYCYNNDNPCVWRVAPPCPVPKFNKYTFQDGYHAGFLKGMRDAD